MAICPMCGYESRGGWSQCDEGHVFEQSIDSLVAAGAGGRGGAVSVPAGVTLERQRPARAADLRSDVAVPCLQAAISGLLATISGGGVAALVGVDVLTAGGVVGGIVMGVAWYLLLRQHRDLLWEIETITGVDLDRDGKTGVPTMTRLEVTVPGDERHGQRTKILELDASSEQLRTWARGMLAGRMSESDWCVGKSKLFQKPQFRKLRQEFIERGLMIWKDEEAHWQGAELTAVGRFVCRALSEQQ